MSDEDLGKVLAGFREVLRKRVLKGYCEGGRVLLEGCYGGSVEVWRSKSGKKRDSLRRIAARADCVFSHATLHKHVALYVACEEMPFVFERKHLSVSHIHAVIGLDRDERVEFLELACAEKWSVRRLQRAVIDYRRDQGERRGAPAATPFRLADTRLSRCERAMKEVVELLSEPEKEPAAPKATAELLGELKRLETLIAGARDHLRRQEPPASSVHSQKQSWLTTEKLGDHAA